MISAGSWRALYVCVRGRSGLPLKILLGEELLGPGRVRYEMRYNCGLRRRFGLSGTDSKHWSIMTIALFATVKSVAEMISVPAMRFWTAQRCQRWSGTILYSETAADFSCADWRLNELWELAKYTTKVGTQEVPIWIARRGRRPTTPLDTPIRDVSGFLPGRGSGVWVGGCIECLLQSAPDGQVRCLAPAAKDHSFTEYTMYPIFTGNLDVLHVQR